MKNSNGAKLADGDARKLIKDLKVKDTSETLKRGTLVKNIRLTANPDEIECRMKGLVLRNRIPEKSIAFSIWDEGGSNLVRLRLSERVE